MLLSRRLSVLCVAMLFALLEVAHLPASAQDSPAPSGAVQPQGQSSSVKTPAKTSKNKYSHANDFLIHGTVFNDKGLSFAGVPLHIRRAGEKKFRWDGVTNSRGEFAIRVPQGSGYEMVVHAKGFAEQSRMIDAKGGGNEQSLVFEMQPSAGDRK